MENIEIRLDNRIRIKKTDLPEKLIETLKNRLVFRNPLFEKNEKYGRSNFNIKPTLQCIWEDKESGDLVMTRGFLYDLTRILYGQRIRFELKDLTKKCPEVNFECQAAAYGYQYEAWQELPGKRFGVLVGPVGSGKKVLAMSLAARRRVPTLVIVTTKRALYQWKEAATRFLGLGQEDIGLIGDGSREIGKKFTIAISLTLYKVLDEVKIRTGFLIVGDCSKVNLKVLFKASLFDCPYQLGLARAPKRQGGLTRLMYAYLGPKLAEIWPEEGWASFQGLGESRPALKIRGTDFRYTYRDDFSEMVTALSMDEDRNSLIVADILEAIADPGAKALVAGERIEHLKELLRQLKDAYVDAEIITGTTTNKIQDEITRRFDRGKLQIILATFKKASDIATKKATCLFVISPLRHNEHLTQLVGKLLNNTNERKRPTIFDYRDDSDILKTSLSQRIRVYRSMGAQ